MLKPILIGVLIVFLLFVAVVVNYFFYLAVCRNAKLPQQGIIDPDDPYVKQINEGIEWISSQNLERVYNTSYDGLKLAADILLADESDGKKARGVLVLVHGFRGSANHDFGVVTPVYHSLGFHLILVHQRAGGDSEGKYITFGIKERYDCQMWAEYAAKRFGSELPIVLDGISMGATTVLMTSALALPSNVKGVIADCGYTSPWEILVEVMDKWFHLKPFPFLYLTNWYCKLRAGFGFKEYSTCEAVKNTTLPILFIHGEADELVPSYMSWTSYEACGSKKRIVTVKDAGHGFSYLVDKETCTQALLDFFDTYVF